jgi:hypothetical protein
MRREHLRGRRSIRSQETESQRTVGGELVQRAGAVRRDALSAALGEIADGTVGDFLQPGGVQGGLQGQPLKDKIGMHFSGIRMG